MEQKKNPAGKSGAGDHFAVGHIGNSTSTVAQRNRILAALSQRPHTSYELRKMGCYQAPTRVIELRRMGYDIKTKRISLWDDEGYEHSGIALYSLEGSK